ncbi:nucleotidyltransferase domain-containing protein [Azohydromonas caseinilytica]|uniref:Nucleotidyltransferase family protein n=1 Tax=Azohydromonas caseinilytica TaxID=2728836 RepID=A0A848F7S8_9BURK|nr:nucleotidyltransferase family protein [Azohydromonas caseinilytica]NML15624.1 nucleotidyltransferase family protein [Azohydromonas caseinilytica]
MNEVPRFVPDAGLLPWALAQPGALPALPLPRWELLLRQARSAGLHGRLAQRLQARGLLEAVPEAPRAHLEAALLLARAQHEEIRREARHLRRALAPLSLPLVLLKGAAYVLAELPAAQGRLFSDTDVLVPLARLAEVEFQLQAHGWRLDPDISAYDQHYYRAWMHELPPMTHQRRFTTVDVHHALLPRTARRHPDTAKLLAAARPTALAGVRVLAPADMVLHAMTHLLRNEEFSHGLRDLSDIDSLLRHFGAEGDFWPALLARARELDLARELHYGLRAARRLLDTPVPEATLRGAAQAAPGPALQPLMDALWARALRCPHPDTRLPLTGAALFLLYLRAHALRMPPGMLLRHAWTKTRLLWRERPAAAGR